MKHFLISQIITFEKMSFVFTLYTLCCLIESVTGNSSIMLNKLYIYIILLLKFFYVLLFIFVLLKIINETLAKR